MKSPVLFERAIAGQITSLQCMSIQHELGMAIGLDLRLDSMLQEFSRVCLENLDLSGVHYFLLHDEAGSLALPDHDDAELGHVLSVPLGSERLVASDQALAMWLELQACGNDMSCSEWRQGEQRLYCFELGEAGCIVLQREGRAVDPAVLALLRPIFARLAVSCLASIEHEQLLIAVSARRQAEAARSFGIYF